VSLSAKPPVVIRAAENSRTNHMDNGVKSDTALASIAPMSQSERV
jgi:hypothetical protein